VTAYFYLGITQLRLGDQAGYRAACKALAELPFSTASDNTKVLTILTWCYGPDALDDMSIVVKRAEELTARNPFGFAHLEYLLGAALLRAGQYDRAAKLLEHSIEVYPTDPPLKPGAASINFQRLLLAMTKWRQGQRDEARRWLAAAQQGIDQEYQPPSPMLDFRIPMEALRREAETLIEPKEADEASNNDNPTPITTLTTDH
jgi:tetratricopeptide (TPR) repeat protein